jgi:hypothetical protein
MDPDETTALQAAPEVDVLSVQITGREPVMHELLIVAAPPDRVTVPAHPSVSWPPTAKSPVVFRVTAVYEAAVCPVSSK